MKLLKRGKNANMKHKIGILAYGSLIDNPGDEIRKLEIGRIQCITPFKVEFSRFSSGRSGAPTLIPVSDGGNNVSGQIILLTNEVGIEEAKSMLYRRERNKVNTDIVYRHIDNPGVNTVIVKALKNFRDVETVLYTSISCNIAQAITAELLAHHAIESILLPAGDEGRDGLRYLRDAKKNGIVTLLSPNYENQILLLTGTTTLDEAIEKLDLQRQESSF